MTRDYNHAALDGAASCQIEVSVIEVSAGWGTRSICEGAKLESAEASLLPPAPLPWLYSQFLSNGISGLAFLKQLFSNGYSRETFLEWLFLNGFS